MGDTNKRMKKKQRHDYRRITVAPQYAGATAVALKDAVKRYMVTSHVMILTGVGGRVHELHASNRSHYVASGAMVLWNNLRYSHVEDSTVTTERVWRNENGTSGGSIETPVVVLVDNTFNQHAYVIVAALALPSGVDRLSRDPNVLRRQDAHSAHVAAVRKEVNRLVRKYRSHAAATAGANYPVVAMIGGNWNMDLRKKRVRRWMALRFPGWKGWQESAIPSRPTTEHGLVDLLIVKGGRVKNPNVRAPHASSNHLALTYVVATKKRK